MSNLLAGNNCKFKGARYEGKARMWFLFAKCGENCRYVEYTGKTFVEAYERAIKGEGGQ